MDATQGAWIIGGVYLPTFILTLVQFLKEQLRLSGPAVRWLSFGIGFVLGMLLLSAQYVGGWYGMIVTWVIVCLQFALSGAIASGVYDTVKQAVGR